MASYCLQYRVSRSRAVYGEGYVICVEFCVDDTYGYTMYDAINKVLKMHADGTLDGTIIGIGCQTSLSVPCGVSRDVLWQRFRDRALSAHLCSPNVLRFGWDAGRSTSVLWIPPGCTVDVRIERPELPERPDVTDWIHYMTSEVMEYMVEQAEYVKMTMDTVEVEASARALEGMVIE